MSRFTLLSSVALISALLTGCNSAFVATDSSSPIPEPQAVNEIAQLNTDLGVGYLREGRMELAYQRLSKALRIQPDYGGALTAMALLLDQLGREDESEAHHRRALAAVPGDSSVLNNFGTFLCRRGRIEEAMPQFERALANPLYNAPESAMTNAGLCLMQNDRPAEAEVYFRKALTRAPRISSALIAMSELSLANGRELAGRGYLQRYLEVARHSSRSLWLGVRIERDLGDKNAVSSYAMLLKANYPDAVETKLLLESEPK